MGVRFLDLPVELRNRATALFADIKLGLKRGFSLSDLGFRVDTWHDVSLSEFRKFPKEHYLRIIEGGSRRNISRQDLIRQVNELYTVFDEKNDGHVGRRLD